jgi:excisionase family DNA binding protein
MVDPAGRVLTTADVAALLGSNDTTVYRLVKARRLPGKREGRRWTFRREDVDAYVESCRVMPRTRPRP